MRFQKSFLLAATLACMAVSQSAFAQFAGTEVPEGLTNITVDADLLNTVRAVLPESRNVDASFLNPSYTPYVELSKDANVFTTFLDEGAGYRNSLGWFSYQSGALDGLTKSDVDSDGSGVVSLAELQGLSSVETGWVFPNASKSGAGGQLNAGDTVSLGDGKVFEAGTVVGFSLVQNGWTGSDVRTSQGADETQNLYSLDFLNPEAEASATLLTDSSSNSSRHVAMLFADDGRTEVVMGFEDLNRVDRTANAYNYSTDEDFNDAVFLVTTNPVDAIAGSNLPVASAPSPTIGSATAILVMVGCGLFGRRESRPA